MSDEIQSSTSLAVVVGGVNSKLQTPTARTDQATPGVGMNAEQDIGTSEVDLVFGIANPAAINIYNDDPDNYVEWGPKTAGVMALLGQLHPGQSSMVHLAPGVVIRAKAHTATCKLLFFLAGP
jgi:hypothetical protein